MDTAVRANHIADLPHLKRISGVFEGFLHLSGLKPAKVSAVVVRRTVGMNLSEFSELGSRAVDLVVVLLEYGNGIFLGARDFGLSFRIC